MILIYVDCYGISVNTTKSQLWALAYGANNNNNYNKGIFSMNPEGKAY